MYGRILGRSPQAGSNRVVSNTIDLPANDFALLAAIGPILRQFSVVSGLRIDDDVSTRELPMTLSLQITDAVERFSLPPNDSEEAPEAMEVTLTPYLAPPPIWLIGRNQHMPRPPPAGRSHNCHRRELKVHRMTASHVQVTEARGLGSI